MKNESDESLSGPAASSATVPELIDLLTIVLSDMRGMSDLAEAPEHVERARDELVKVRQLALSVMREAEGDFTGLPAAVIGGSSSKDRLLN